MDDFKKTIKMQCFKEGGSVRTQVSNYTKRDRKVTDTADIAQDKAVVKKAIAIHDKQEHPGEKTDLSKLKKGGRTKKAVGTVKKYKTGGSVDNVYSAKKKSGDLDNIKKTKDIKPTKLCGGGKAVKKMADGGGVLDSIGSGIRDAVLGTPAQNAAARQAEAKYLRAKRLQQASGAPMSAGETMATNLAGLGQQLQPAPAPALGPQMQPAASTVPAGQKRGGKVKK